MPEGPEVYVATVWLENHLLGATITHMHNITGMHLALPAKVLHVDHWGKIIYLSLIDAHHKPMVIINHLGMTGDWTDKIGPYNRATITYSFRGSHNIFFVDPRRFGSIKVANVNQLNNELTALGYDVMAPGFTLKLFRELAALRAKSTMPIAATLSDQKFISGIGNYLRSEILDAAHIDPRIPTNVVFASPDKIAILYKAICKVIRSATKMGGLRNGWKPAIYGRATDDKGHPIKKVNIGGRNVYYR